ncbi:hypothetical protein [Sphingomonas sp. MM-1]|uniref:hypothetical protein n=1 Tax=Sphingomonas sp. MM-1 TaxID=745310 RepID=UPI001650F752|nr:hypothetical protein [Sphingomonas sp. MM-1]
MQQSPLADLDGITAPDQISREEADAGLDRADFIDAHDGGLQRAHVELVGAGLVPSAALEIFVHDVAAIGLEDAGHQVLERAAPQGHGPVIPDDAGQFVGIDVELRENRPQMIVERVMQVVGPLGPCRELHQPGQVVAAFHAGSSIVCRCAATMRETVGSLT